MLPLASSERFMLHIFPIKAVRGTRGDFVVVAIGIAVASLGRQDCSRWRPEQITKCPQRVESGHWPRARRVLARVASPSTSGATAMPRKTNYDFERREREKNKAADSAKKLQAKADKKASDQATPGLNPSD